ncbi:MAG: FtsX-like permease family protein [Pseudomonadota bacterium]
MSFLAPLDRKLVRDLWRIKGQAGATATVMGLGVLLLVMMTSLVNTLGLTKAAYYDRFRMADVFAPVERAPDRLLQQLADIPGVAQAQSRVQGMATLDLPGDGMPPRAQVLSLPYLEPARLNDVFIAEGRKPEEGRSNEVLLLKRFAEARGIVPGDTLSATMNGNRHTFLVTGLAQSPEFIYATAPGEFIPDDARFGAIWMDRDTLSAAYDLKGAFNEALLRLESTAETQAVLDAIDRVLARQGGLGAYALADQKSNFFLSQEIAGARKNAIGIPPIFLGVAAFLLSVIVSRIVQSERGQIGLMKAFGYTSREISAHYFKMILAIALSGALVGSLAGIFAGRGMAAMYQEYYKFPFLIFRLSPWSFGLAFAVAILSASAGAVGVLRRIFELTAAEAMRPPAPVDYSRTGKAGAVIRRLLDAPGRMVIRRLQRQPLRMLGGILGISGGMALAIGMIGVQSGFALNLHLAFTVLDRSDAQVTLTHAMSEKVIYELGEIAGIEDLEPTRNVPVVFRSGLYTHRGSIDGLVQTPHLKRAFDTDHNLLPMPDAGIVLSKTLAGVLHAEVGDTILAKVLDGRRPQLELTVVALADALMGTPAYMSLEALNVALEEEERMTGAFLKLDEEALDDVVGAVKGMPDVDGFVLKSDVRNAIQTMMDTGVGALRFVMLAVAGVVTFGIVYNSARIAFTERARELASMRVLGFTRGETSFVLLGELGLITILALPLGALFGYGISAAVSVAFSSEVYSIPLMFERRDVAMAAAVVLLSSAISGFLVKRDVDRIELVSALKTRE